MEFSAEIHKNVDLLVFFTTVRYNGCLTLILLYSSKTSDLGLNGLNFVPLLHSTSVPSCSSHIQSFSCSLSAYTSLSPAEM